ncbi:MAG: hypothetical protein ACI8UO_006321, partial [Verrucomicrobiales bacterium]
MRYARRSVDGRSDKTLSGTALPRRFGHLGYLRRKKRLLAFVWFVTMASLLMWQVEPYANPHEPNVVRGSVEFDDVLDGHLKIH